MHNIRLLGSVGLVLLINIAAGAPKLPQSEANPFAHTHYNARDDVHEFCDDQYCNQERTEAQDAGWDIYAHVSNYFDNLPPPYFSYSHYPAPAPAIHDWQSGYSQSHLQAIEQEPGHGQQLVPVEYHARFPSGVSEPSSGGHFAGTGPTPGSAPPPGGAVTGSGPPPGGACGPGRSCPPLLLPAPERRQPVEIAASDHSAEESSADPVVVDMTAHYRKKLAEAEEEDRKNNKSYGRKFMKLLKKAKGS